MFKKIERRPKEGSPEKTEGTDEGQMALKRETNIEKELQKIKSPIEALLLLKMYSLGGKIDLVLICKETVVAYKERMHIKSTG